MKIKIGHLFPLELNLYGENGNIKALKYYLDNKGIEVDLVNINKDDKINFLDYDMLYVGSGTKKYLDIVKNRLKDRSKELRKYVESNKVLLITGNALGIFAFLDYYQVIQTKKRVVSDVIASTHLCPDIIRGFQNSEYIIKTMTGILFNMDKGMGNNGTKLEGFNYKNLYVTSIIGPILARNDKLCAYFGDLISNGD